MTKLLAVLACLFAVQANAACITGCAQAVEREAQAPANVLTQLHADLQAAAALADAATDVMAATRAKCYRVLDAHIPTAASLPNFQAATGVVSKFELKAQLVEAKKAYADEGIPVEVVVACGPVLMRKQEVLLSFGLRVSGFGGLLPK